MSVLGKIRSKGVILISVIGFALFAFIAEEAFRSWETNRNNERQQLGKVLGEKIDVQEFQKLVEEYTEVVKMQQGKENLSEEEQTQVRDMVWNSFVQNKIIEKEAKTLGLTVTDGEIQDLLTAGTNPMLMSTPFINQQTGRFDINALKKFLADYKTQKNTNPQLARQYENLYKYWMFIEKNLRQQLLAQKYQALFANCFLSNPIEAKMAFKDNTEESSIQLASFPYTSINDSKIQVSESDLKSKYDELKERFKQPIETRNIKYVDVQVKPSAKDVSALNTLFATYRTQLAEATNPNEVVRRSTSLVPYLGVAIGKSAYPSDIASRIDSMSVGQVYGPFTNKQDNTLNLIKLVSAQQLPDSVEYRQIQVGGATVEAARKTADSIYVALNKGADFEALAKKYGQTGAKQWLTGAQYEHAPSLDNDTKTLLEILQTAGVNEVKNLAFTQGNIIVQVLNKKAMTTKYVAAVVKKTIDFSQDTYSAAYNKFSSFVSANTTPEAIMKNATKQGYTVLERKDVTTAEHYLAGVRGTREALKWLFDAKENEVSPMYQCGDNDHLLLVILDKINPAGYRSLADAQVKEIVKAEVMKDKKAEQLMAKAQGVKTIAAAKAKGAIVADLAQITFAAPVFIPTTGASEPALSGAVSATAKGKFCAMPVKGNAGVYLFQVTNKTTAKVPFKVKEEEQKLRQRYMQYAGSFMNELYLNAKVTDNRYLFF